MMKTTANHQTEPTGLPILSSQAQGWENILVEQFQHPAGEGNCHYSDEHAICLSLAPRPVRLLQIKGGKTYAGLYGKGDISITPAKMPFFARWDRDDHYLQIRIASGLIESVARETIDTNPDRLELRLEFRTRDPQIEAIGMAPYQYLLQQRVEQAKQLLKQTDQSIMDIALECGFSSHSL